MPDAVSIVFLRESPRFERYITLDESGQSAVQLYTNRITKILATCVSSHRRSRKFCATTAPSLGGVTLILPSGGGVSHIAANTRALLTHILAAKGLDGGDRVLGRVLI